MNVKNFFDHSDSKESKSYKPSKEIIKSYKDHSKKKKDPLMKALMKKKGKCGECGKAECKCD